MPIDEHGWIDGDVAFEDGDVVWCDRELALLLMPIIVASHGSLIGSERQRAPFDVGSDSDLQIEGESDFGARLTATISSGPALEI